MYAPFCCYIYTLPYLSTYYCPYNILVTYICDVVLIIFIIILINIFNSMILYVYFSLLTVLVLINVCIHLYVIDIVIVNFVNIVNSKPTNLVCIVIAIIIIINYIILQCNILAIFMSIQLIITIPIVFLLIFKTPYFILSFYYLLLMFP